MADDPTNEDRLYAHLSVLLSVSSGMVGVCVTAIGLIGVIRSLNRLETLVDDLLVVGAVLFLTVTSLSFLGLRTRLIKTGGHYAVVLDVLFCMGLFVLVLASVLLAWVML